MGDAAAAVPALRGALEASPGNADITVSLADSYVLAGWFDDANELLDEALGATKGRRSPEVSLYYHRKARVAEAQGDRPKQLELLQEAHLCAKKNGMVAAALADLAEELEEWDLAAKTLRTITLIDDDCPISRPQAFLRQGRIAQRLGDDKSARMWARRARREDPESQDIEQLLLDLGEKVR
jgi:tetratricopeptide (TPR) repeat protein